MPYPTVEDLTNYLTSSGLFPGTMASILAGMDLETEIDAAIAWWEETTRYIPFLATTQTRTYDPPGPEHGPVGLLRGVGSVGGSRILFLRAGLISLTSLTTGLDTSDSVGEVLTENDDFWLRPQNASYSNRPYLRIEFRFPQYGSPGSIQIVGVWGATATLRADAFKAILKQAAAAVCALLDLNLSGGISQIETPSLKIAFGGRGGKSALQGASDTWQQEALATATLYQRKSLI